MDEDKISTAFSTAYGSAYYVTFDVNNDAPYRSFIS